MPTVKDKAHVFPVDRHVRELTDAELVEVLIGLAKGHWWGVDTNRLGIVKEELMMRLGTIQFHKGQQAKIPEPKDLASTLISSPNVPVPEVTVPNRLRRPSE
jgi:ligand-binding sensor domain-containing protein